MVCALGKKIAVQERACGATRTSAKGAGRESVRVSFSTQRAFAKVAIGPPGAARAISHRSRGS